MSWLLQLLINAGILLLMAQAMPSVKVRNYGTAIGVALLVGLLNATIGALLRFPINLVTLWLVSFLVRLIVTALMMLLADKLMSGFEVKGFWPAFLIALVIAVVGTLIGR